MTESTATTNIFQVFKSHKLLAGILDFCKANKHGLALWKLPSEENLTLYIDDSDSFKLEDGSLEDLPEGFIFAPFEKDGDRFYIKAKLKIDLTQQTIHGDQTLQSQLESYLEGFEFSPSEDKINIEANPSEDFIELVNKSIGLIQEGEFQKVVPSRFKRIAFDNAPDASQIFLKLTNTYENSFVSLCYTSETKLWIGATPETLIKIKDDIFTTVALAGTQAFNPAVANSDIAWTQKEIEEQAFVSRYIINCFKKIRLREFDEIGPKTVQAGNLIHLKTNFSVDMKATNFPQLGSVMLDLLHPTSAICGMPMESAYSFLKQNEHYDRRFFSGYLGPVKNNGETAVFVNLRCMELDEDKGTLFAGAGVTESSNPQKEWNETELKMNTILNVLQS